jgi:EAL domain-containing protein (putative c-di-GMP-specific phosphodiesterase class I)
MTNIAVNVSSVELRDRNFLPGIFAILEDTGLDPRCLELELTESVLMKQAESAASILQTLRARGVRVAIDDFGTGYSSLSYLRKFPIDALKIDQSFVSYIGSAGDDASIVTAVISMARSLSLRVIAEGVETADQRDFLVAQGCDEAQGFSFSRPIPAEEFAALLRRGQPLRCVPLDRPSHVGASLDADPRATKVRTADRRRRRHPRVISYVAPTAVGPVSAAD